MRTYRANGRDTRWTIAAATILQSTYRDIPTYARDIVSLNATDDGSGVPLIRDWTVLSEGTVVRLPE